MNVVYNIYIDNLFCLTQKLFRTHILYNMTAKQLPGFCLA